MARGPPTAPPAVSHGIREPSSGAKRGRSLPDSKSRVVKGSAGVARRFTFLFSRGSSLHGSDLYGSVIETEVVRSYSKTFDTAATVNLVCLSRDAMRLRAPRRLGKA